MSNITRTDAQVAEVFPEKAVMFSAKAAATIAKGDLLYFTSAGLVNIADGDGSGTTAPCGIALNAAGTGQAVNVLKEGHVYGWTLTSVAYYAPLYMSDTAGALGDGAGSTSFIVGRVVPMSDASLTKVLYVDIKWG